MVTTSQKVRDRILGGLNRLRKSKSSALLREGPCRQEIAPPLPAPHLPFPANLGRPLLESDHLRRSIGGKSYDDHVVVASSSAGFEHPDTLKGRTARINTSPSRSSCPSKPNPFADPHPSSNPLPIFSRARGGSPLPAGSAAMKCYPRNGSEFIPSEVGTLLQELTHENVPNLVSSTDSDVSEIPSMPSTPSTTRPLKFSKVSVALPPTPSSPNSTGSGSLGAEPTTPTSSKRGGNLPWVCCTPPKRVLRRNGPMPICGPFCAVPGISPPPAAKNSRRDSHMSEYSDSSCGSEFSNASDPEETPSVSPTASDYDPFLYEKWLAPTGPAAVHNGGTTSLVTGPTMDQQQEAASAAPRHAHTRSLTPVSTSRSEYLSVQAIERMTHRRTDVLAALKSLDDLRETRGDDVSETEECSFGNKHASDLSF